MPFLFVSGVGGRGRIRKHYEETLLSGLTRIVFKLHFQSVSEFRISGDIQKTLQQAQCSDVKCRVYQNWFVLGARKSPVSLTPVSQNGWFVTLWSRIYIKPWFHWFYHEMNPLKTHFVKSKIFHNRIFSLFFDNVSIIRSKIFSKIAIKNSKL